MTSNLLNPRIASGNSVIFRMSPSLKSKETILLGTCPFADDISTPFKNTLTINLLRSPLLQKVIDREMTC